jgi:hypothetical protein
MAKLVYIIKLVVVGVVFLPVAVVFMVVGFRG